MTDIVENMREFGDMFPITNVHEFIDLSLYLTQRAAEIERLRAENERLMEQADALRSLVALNDNYSPFGGEMYQDRIDRAWERARAALKGDSDE